MGGYLATYEGFTSVANRVKEMETKVEKTLGYLLQNRKTISREFTGHQKAESEATEEILRGLGQKLEKSISKTAETTTK